MEFITAIKPIIWKIIDKKKKYAVNVSSLDNELTVSILSGRKTKRFTNKDSAIVLSQLEKYLIA
jgi:hypothetical protein